MPGCAWAGSRQPARVVVEVDAHVLEALVPLRLDVLGVNAAIGVSELNSVGERGQQRSLVEAVSHNNVDLQTEHGHRRGEVDQREQPEHQRKDGVH